MPQPVHRRRFSTLLVHSSNDHEAADQLDLWLSDLAGLNVRRQVGPTDGGVEFVSRFSEAAKTCRSVLFIVSKSSVSASWLAEAHEWAVQHARQERGFRFVGVRIDDSPMPEFLAADTKSIHATDGKLAIQSAFDLLVAIQYADVEITKGMRDVYVCRSWRDSDAEPADLVCQLLDDAGFRLIGDSKDHRDFGQGERVKSIIAGCGGTVAVLPHRGEGKTSPFILQEVALAKEMDIPELVFAESSVELSPEMERSAVRFDPGGLADHGDAIARIRRHVEVFDESWRSPPKPHYVFLATDLAEESRKTNQLIRELIHRITGMPCVVGEKIREGLIQQVITDKIRGAMLMIADLTEDSVNTLIEAGIARGAGTPFLLIERISPDPPPFMLADQEVTYYRDEVELLGIVHALVYPFRRRVLNYEHYSATKSAKPGTPTRTRQASSS